MGGILPYEPVAGFDVAVHRALTEPILLGGAPRAVAIANGTLAAAVGLGLRLWIPGLIIWAIGQLRSLTRMQLVRTLASWRPDLTAYRDLDSAYRIGLKSLARRYLELHDEIADLDVMIAAIVDELAANLIARNSIGHIGAAQLLLTAGDNPERLRSEASFASLCGVSPVPASSGKTVRHRLNRGGDRAANSALHIIAIGRLRTDQRTKDYVARRIAEGHSKLDAIRALKRYLAREVFTLITQRRKEINATRIAA